MTKHHAKHRKHHSADNQAGFLSFSPKKLMDKKSRILILVIALGIIILFALSFVMVMNKNKVDEELSSITPTPPKRITTPYPTIPQSIKDTTILVNARSINPTSVKITVGGTVGFFNEDTEPVEIRGYDAGSSVLNVGVIQPYDVPFVKFDKEGVYKFINPQNPEEVGEVTVVGQ